MPWSTPTLRTVRSLVRDFVNATLPGADSGVPNSVLRVISDAMGALCHLTLQYIDWLALQLLPDTAEHEWLDRHGQIWLVNSDGTVGRKLATLASGTITLTGTAFTLVPQGTQVSYAQTIGYETMADINLAEGGAPTTVAARALDPGTQGNLAAGTQLGVEPPYVAGLDNTATVVTMQGGTDDETDPELRARVLRRIRLPPMGGDKTDYEAWALAVPGVTRAWSGPLEMGMGTVTVRFMMDDLRASNGGFPTNYDVTQVNDYLNTVRPVAVKDFFVVAPIPQPIDVFVQKLSPDTSATRAGVETSLTNMLFAAASPGQTIYAAWVYYAIMNTAGVDYVELLNATDQVMASPGHMPSLGNIVYGSSPIDDL